VAFMKSRREIAWSMPRVESLVALLASSFIV
jgi:hypothetical protein